MSSSTNLSAHARTVSVTIDANADDQNTESQWKAEVAEHHAFIRNTRISILKDSRKRSLDSCFTDECNLRSLIGGPKITFWCHYTHWVDGHVSSTNEGYYDEFVSKKKTNSAMDRAIMTVIADLDRQAWEGFVAKEFENQPPPPSPSPSVPKPKPKPGTKSTRSLIRKYTLRALDSVHTPKTPISTKPSSKAEESSGWKKDASGQTLRKAVLLANAVNMARMVFKQCGVQSREKSVMLKKERGSALSAVQA
ncbi:hypothetical protein EV361DRAFT_863439 [Lentinula raphanica]|uniref:Uncharacterized protein n=1 Tax=Lentinula raphanica TaxID=153919 RepID=A0AA38PEG5_9AGAR|nr:hypothetical protein F5880DRAFT_33551 [Lentinula raphanica]KAJ3841430.1 hypothetical protein F5878DRAFT_658503 [Lentinula raphanica]KAJ3978061.1 hypothetical protein EV361DRAFT_863439 [Lentinula raphanica]